MTKYVFFSERLSLRELSVWGSIRGLMVRLKCAGLNKEVDGLEDKNIFSQYIYIYLVFILNKNMPLQYILQQYIFLEQMFVMKYFLWHLYHEKYVI